MDLNTLKAFVAVAETSSFSLAAEQIHLTQSAVSKRIAALESELGVKLFDRIGKSTRLNESGQQLLPRAINMLQEMEDIQRSISNLSGDVAGKLKMGTSHHIGLHRLPPVLRRFRQEFNQVQLDIQFMGSEDVCDKVAQGQLELGIVTLPDKPPENLNLSIIWRDRLQIVASREHPLVTVSDPTIEDLMNYPALLPGKGTFTLNILEQAILPANLNVDVALSTNYLETLKAMASTGLGWSMLPEVMTRETDLQIIDIPGLDLQRNLGAVTHSSRTLSNAAQAMINLCSKEMF